MSVLNLQGSDIGFGLGCLYIRHKRDNTMMRQHQEMDIFTRFWLYSRCAVKDRGNELDTTTDFMLEEIRSPAEPDSLG